MGVHHSTKQAKAGLVFPVSRFIKKLKTKNIAGRMSSTAPVFITGVVESVIKHILVQAAENATANKTTRVNLEDFVHAVRQDVDTARLFGSFAFSSATQAPKAIDCTLPQKDQQLRRRRIREQKEAKKTAKAIALEAAN